MTPTTEEKYTHMRDNALAFVGSMEALVAAAERDGNEDLASKLRVWCLNPWVAAINADNTGELWEFCEACGEPIKDDSDRAASDDCQFHRSCVEDTAPVTPPMTPPKPNEPERASRREDWHYDSQGYCDNPGRGY